MEFTRLERAAIEAIVSKRVEGMEIVREQYAAASVIERDYTGVGFYTKIAVPPSVAPMPDSKMLHDALFDGAYAAASSGSPNVIVFLLWTHAGYLACLDGFTTDSAWPNEDDIGDVSPSSLRTPVGKPSSADRLLPNCESRFEDSPLTASQKTLLVILLFIALLLILLALMDNAR